MSFYFFYFTGASCFWTGLTVLELLGGLSTEALTGAGDILLEGGGETEGYFGLYFGKLTPFITNSLYYRWKSGKGPSGVLGQLVPHYSMAVSSVVKNLMEYASWSRLTFPKISLPLSSSPS